MQSLGESGECSYSSPLSPLGSWDGRGRTAMHFQKVRAKIREKNHPSPSSRPEQHSATPQGRLTSVLAGRKECRMWQKKRASF